MSRNFRELLTRRQIEARSLVCVGLDPLTEKLPEVVRASCTTVADAILVWMREVVDATAAYASMFKPQRAHWEAIPGGVEALRALVAYIHYKYPWIPVFLDCKRGDIDRTQGQYRVAHFEIDGVDGMNFNGYMGRDTLKSLIHPDHMGRGLVGLGRTSNKEAWEVQDQELRDGRKLWEFMVGRLHLWSAELGVLENAGVVMGAAHKDPANSEKICSWHLARAREIVGSSMWFLIPGIGTQKGFIEQTISVSYSGPGSIAVNSSSGITNASSGPDFAEAAGREAKKLRDDINQALA